MSKQRLIDADEFRIVLWDILEDAFASETDNWRFNSIIETLDEQPTVDAAPVVHGDWEQDGIYQRCSKCLTNFATEDSDGDELIFNYCPYCGAKMDLESEEKQ